MAVSSMAKGSILLPFPNLVPQRFSNTSLNYVVFQSKQQQLVKFHMIRSNSNDTSSSSSTVETTITSPEDATTQEEEDSIEETEESPSLISALNVERALRGIPITDVDYYGKLGLSRDCSLNQVNDAYRIKSEELKNRGLEEEELNKELQLLKESYTILSTVEERRLYDWSLSRSEKTDKYVWPFEVDSTKPPQDEPPQQGLDRVQGSRYGFGFESLCWVWGSMFVDGSGFRVRSVYGVRGQNQVQDSSPMLGFRVDVQDQDKEPEDIGPTRAVGYFILGWVILSTVLSIALNR
ncbi:hypothetical protein G4B88_011536 [Cannabis sativa]|uniref:J domain-containing protein n=1 Tax=Cannabis sativa TaxID=3483 RepID=A0A7J6GH83_CANSA|nr:hypothetical protein G4B88_011536 [Cannabis sativa]